MTANQPDQEKAPTEDERREATERDRAIAATHFQGAFAAGKERPTVWPVLLIVTIMLALGAVWYMLRPPPGGLSDAEVRDQIIKESIAAYQKSGRPCACPFSPMADGKQCGDFSAYRQPGAAAPLCYPKDISNAMVRDWRQRNAR